jgi:hypothetical protein
MNFFGIIYSKYIKLHVLGDFGDIWIGILEDIQKNRFFE